MAMRAVDAGPRQAEPVSLPALADGDGVLILMNSEAGKAVIRINPRPTIAERLPRATVRLLDEDESLDDAVRAAMSSPEAPTVLGVFGGDGSVSRMAGLAREFEVPLLGLPGGTFNHFLRAAGVDSVDAAIDALQAGTGIAVSVAEVTTSAGTETVLNVASVGNYAQFLAARTKRTDRLGKWIGGVVAAWRAVRAAEPIDIELDGRPMRVWSLFAGVGRHETGRIAMMQRETLSDDVLDVRALSADVSSVRAVAALSFGRASTRLLRMLRLVPSDRYIERVVAGKVELVLSPGDRGATFFVHDGELQRRPASDDDGRVRLSCRIVPRVLKVYAP